MKETTNQQKTTSSSSNDIYKAEKRIDLLFSKFAAFYGHIWRSQFKDEVFFKFAKKEWQEALSGFSDEILSKGILSCREFYELPPTLPQMIVCCRQIKKQIEVCVKEEDYQRANEKIVAANLQQMSKILAK